MYERWAIFYNLIITLLTILAGGEKRYRIKVLRMAEIKPDEKVLDICCGRGKLTSLISQPDKQPAMVIGLDYCMEILTLARQRSEGKAITYILANASSLPFRDSSFDKLFISMSLHEMWRQERIAAINEAYRILNNDGLAIFVDFDQPQKPGLRYRLVTKIEEYQDQEVFMDFMGANLRQEIEGAGFRIKETALALGRCLQIIAAYKNRQDV